MTLRQLLLDHNFPIILFLNRLLLLFLFLVLLHHDRETLSVDVLVLFVAELFPKVRFPVIALELLNHLLHLFKAPVVDLCAVVYRLKW